MLYFLAAPLQTGLARRALEAYTRASITPSKTSSKAPPRCATRVPPAHFTLVVQGIFLNLGRWASCDTPLSARWGPFPSRPMWQAPVGPMPQLAAHGARRGQQWSPTQHQDWAGEGGFDPSAIAERQSTAYASQQEHHAEGSGFYSTQQATLQPWNNAGSSLNWGAAPPAWTANPTNRPPANPAYSTQHFHHEPPAFPTGAADEMNDGSLKAVRQLPPAFQSLFTQFK